MPQGSAAAEGSLIDVAATVFLQGAYAGSASMRTTLRSSGLVPTTQPYGASSYDGTPLDYDGSESVDAVPANVVDWVLVELRSSPGGTPEATRAAFLMSDGRVMDTDGTSSVTFSGLFSGNYYVVVRHRNHLPVMSAGAVSLPNGGSPYDFTGGQGQAYGSDPMAALGDGAFGLVAGDADADGTVKFGGRSNDPTVVFNAVGQDAFGTVTGYLRADIDLNGTAKVGGRGNDPTVVFNAVEQDAFGTRSSQVPD